MAATLPQQAHVPGRCAFARPRHRFLAVRRLPSDRRAALAPAAHLQFQQPLCTLPPDDRLIWQACRGRLLGHAGVPGNARCRQRTGRPPSTPSTTPTARTSTWSTGDEMEKAHVAYVSGNMFPALWPPSPRLAVFLPPPMIAVPVSIPMRSSPGTIGIIASDSDPHILGRSVHHRRPDLRNYRRRPTRLYRNRKWNDHRRLSARQHLNSFATQDNITWHRTFLMLNPGVNPATVLRATPPASLCDQPHLRRAVLRVPSRHDSGRDRSALSIKKLVFKPAGSGISDLQKDYRRYLGVLGLLAALVLPHRLRPMLPT